jgi:hypothetical protein
VKNRTPPKSMLCAPSAPHLTFSHLENFSGKGNRSKCPFSSLPFSRSRVAALHRVRCELQSCTALQQTGHLVLPSAAAGVHTRGARIGGVGAAEWPWVTGLTSPKAPPMSSRRGGIAERQIFSRCALAPRIKRCGVCSARCLPRLGRGDWLEAVAGARGEAHRFFLSDFGRCSGWHWLHSVHLPLLVRSRRYQWFPLVTSQNVSYACEYFVLCAEEHR